MKLPAWRPEPGNQPKRTSDVFFPSRRFRIDLMVLYLALKKIKSPSSSVITHTPNIIINYNILLTR